MSNNFRSFLVQIITLVIVKNDEKHSGFGLRRCLNQKRAKCDLFLLVAIFIFSTLFYSENVYSHENIEILERYVLEELALSDIRWNTDNKAWKACFKTPSGFYVTTFASQSIGKLGMIMNIDKLSVTVRQYFPINEDETEWDERYIRLELPENYFCDWKYSVPNYAVPPEY